MRPYPKFAQLGFWSALAAANVGAATALWTLTRALQVDDRAVAADARIALPHITLARTDVVEAPRRLADDPFFAGRTPPATRYQLIERVEAQSPRSARASVPTILGTVIGSDGSNFAIGAMNGAPPTTLRVGSSIQGYRVVAIDRGRVAFTAPDGRQVEVRTDRARSNAAADTNAAPNAAARGDTGAAPPSSPSSSQDGFTRRAGSLPQDVRECMRRFRGGRGRGDAGTDMATEPAAPPSPDAQECTRRIRSWRDANNSNQD